MCVILLLRVYVKTRMWQQFTHLHNSGLSSGKNYTIHKKYVFGNMYNARVKTISYGDVYFERKKETVENTITLQNDIIDGE